jgi:hypothetical protein
MGRNLTFDPYIISSNWNLTLSEDIQKSEGDKIHTQTHAKITITKENEADDNHHNKNACIIRKMSPKSEFYGFSQWNLSEV